MNIQPTVIPTQGTATQILIRALGFDLPVTGSINSYYCLQDENGAALIDGNMDIPEEIVMQWGTDDSIVIDYVISQLGLVEVESIEEQIIEEQTT